MSTLPPLRIGRPRAEHGFIRPIDGLEIPFGLVEGERPGPVLLVTAGVHGSEYCSIETALQLMRHKPEGLAGTILVLPLLNPSGFRQRSVYVMPEDGRNLNRMFPGNPEGSFSERLAHWLVSEIYPKADAYLDLHGGDLSEMLLPFSLFSASHDASRDLALAFGLPVAVASGGETYTIAAATKLGVPSVIAEVGANGIWDEAGVAMMMAGIERVLHHLGMVATPGPTPPPVQLTDLRMPPAGANGLWYPVKELDETVAEGEILGEIRNLFGELVDTVRSPISGTVLFRLSSLVVNRGEALIGIASPL